MKIIIKDDGKSIGLDVEDCNGQKPSIKELVGIIEYAKLLLVMTNKPTEVQND